MEAFKLSKPDRRKYVRQQKKPPFPIPVASQTGRAPNVSNWYYHTAYLEGGCVYVSHSGDMDRLYTMGFFGKGTLSRHHPTYNRPQGAHTTGSVTGTQLQVVSRRRFLRHVAWSSAQIDDAAELARNQETSTVATTMATDGTGECGGAKRRSDTAGERVTSPQKRLKGDPAMDGGGIRGRCGDHSVGNDEDMTSVGLRPGHTQAERESRAESSELYSCSGKVRLEPCDDITDSDPWAEETESDPWAEKTESDPWAEKTESEVKTEIAKSDSLTELTKSDRCIEERGLERDAGSGSLPDQKRDCHASASEETREPRTTSETKPRTDEPKPGMEGPKPGELTKHSDTLDHSITAHEVAPPLDPRSLSDEEDGSLFVVDDSAGSGDEETATPAAGWRHCIKRDPYPVAEKLQLSLEEAFFLSFGLGCLILYEDKAKLDLLAIWRRFCDLQPTFPYRYVAYHYFRSKGWVPKAGIKYGADFTLYKEGPAFYHSTYCVVVRPVRAADLQSDLDDKTRAWDWTSIATANRITEQVGKDLMLCYVIRPDDLQNEHLNSPECVSGFQVQEVVLRRWVSRHERENMQLLD